MAVRDPLVAAADGDHLSAARAAATPSSAGEPIAAGPIAAGPTAAEAFLGHRFARPRLLAEALTHRSAISGKRLSRGRQAPSSGCGSNERLEFVGDRVLGLLMAEWLAERFPDEQEGRLGPRLAHLVSQPVIAAIAEQRGLPALLSVAEGESRAGVRHRATVLADAVEALIGATYLDAGLEPARRFVRAAWATAIEEHVEPPKDAKTALQEFLLARGRPLPVYDLAGREGPPHEPLFTIRVTAGESQATAAAGTKRMAERLAAEALLRTLSA